VAILTAAYLVRYILSKPAGSDRMQELSQSIYRGAMTFLNEEYRTIAVFVVVVMAVLVGASFYSEDMPVETALSFLVGAIFSALAGNIGMRIATQANARTAEGVKKNLNNGLRIAFSSGAVMGLSVAGLGILGVFLFYWAYTEWFSVSDASLTSILFGFGFGASSIALFARVGGGIYTKSADVGADIVGKVEAGIPEDDPRNPATIADNVGDNVGDVAGMGADLFESYVDSIIAGISLAVLGYAAFGEHTELYPLVIVALGAFASIAAMLLVRGKNAYAALRNGLFGSAIIFALLAFIATYYLLDSLDPFYAILVGLIDGIIIGLATEYFTSDQRSPTQGIARAAQTGPATDIIQGMSVGMLSVFIPVLATAIAMVLAFEFAGFYGVALAAVGMLSPPWACPWPTTATDRWRTTRRASPKWPIWARRYGSGRRDWTRWATPRRPWARALPSARRPSPPWPWCSPSLSPWRARWRALPSAWTSRRSWPACSSGPCCPSCSRP